MMSEFVQKVFALAQKNGFLLSLGDSIHFGPSGQLLRHNICQEWLFSNSVDTVDPMFPLGEECCRLDDWKGLKQAFSHMKQLTGLNVPFGFVEVRPRYRSSSQINNCEETDIFTPKISTLARTCRFETPSNAAHSFDYWQRQRKMWWRKFSNSPGRFALTDVKFGDRGTQKVDIIANLPHTTMVVETVKLHTPFEQLEAEDRSDFEVKDGRRIVLPHVIESCTLLETAALTYLCDAYEEKTLNEEKKPVLSFHHRLAPFKVAFAASPAGGTVAQDITELAGFLSRVLKRTGFSTLLLPDFGKKTLDFQNNRNDEMGIPYCIILNESALKNGVVGLRNRDTTLKEQVHVSELKKYITILLKSY